MADEKLGRIPPVPHAYLVIPYAERDRHDPLSEDQSSALPDLERTAVLDLRGGGDALVQQVASELGDRYERFLNAHDEPYADVQVNVAYFKINQHSRLTSACASGQLTVGGFTDQDRWHYAEDVTTAIRDIRGQQVASDIGAILHDTGEQDG